MLEVVAVGHHRHLHVADQAAGGEVEAGHGDNLMETEGREKIF